MWRRHRRRPVYSSRVQRRAAANNQPIDYHRGPCPCIESVSVNEQIACSKPGNTCDTFGSSAAGFAGISAPDFCFQIVISNSGTIPLDGLTVTGSFLPNLTSQFQALLTASYPTGVLPPGGGTHGHYPEYARSHHHHQHRLRHGREHPFEFSNRRQFDRNEHHH